MNPFFVIQIVLFLISCVIGIVTYPMLPDLVPIHWNLHGIADGWVRKEIALPIIPLITLLMIGLFHILPKIDPKKQNYAKFTRSWEYMQIGVILFFVYLYALTICTALYSDLEIRRYIVGGISALFVFMGLLLRNVKQNYWIGYKLPWTLEDSDVWDATHRLGGKLFLFSGVVGIAVSIFPNTTAGYGIWLISIMFMIVLPIVFSYRIYRKNRQKK